MFSSLQTIRGGSLLLDVAYHIQTAKIPAAEDCLRKYTCKAKPQTDKRKWDCETRPGYRTRPTNQTTNRKTRKTHSTYPRRYELRKRITAHIPMRVPYIFSKRILVETRPSILVITSTHLQGVLWIFPRFCSLTPSVYMSVYLLATPRGAIKL